MAYFIYNRNDLLEKIMMLVRGNIVAMSLNKGEVTGSHAEVDGPILERGLGTSSSVIVGKAQYMGVHAGKWVDMVEE